MSADILDPAALTAKIPSVLPESAKILKSPQDGITVLLHAAMTIVGFRLIAVDDESSPQTLERDVLPENWNKNGPSHYTLRYKHNQSTLEFVLKISKLGSRTMINAIALESDKASSLDLSTNDYISPSFYPHNLSEAADKPLVHGFISSNRITDLISQFRLMILQKLMPGLRKEGYIELPADSNEASTSAAQNQGNPAAARAPPRPNNPPRPEEDIYGGTRSPYRPLNPLEIGRRDLDPIPMNPFAPPPLFPGSGGDGMFVGPDHPIFGARGGRGGLGSIGGGRGPWGGDGFLPPMGAPPGARFDPVVPGGYPSGRGGFGGLPLPDRGLPGGRGSGDPDNDEFMPPGMENMYN